jgi:hypothetical protein
MDADPPAHERFLGLAAPGGADAPVIERRVHALCHECGVHAFGSLDRRCVDQARALRRRGDLDGRARALSDSFVTWITR